MTENLYNLSDGKTKTVLEYVEGLKCPEAFTLKQDIKFNEIKKKVSQQGLIANEMLDIIGYNPIGSDAIFDV